MRLLYSFVVSAVLASAAAAQNQTAVAEPAGELTLQQAIALAASQHPDIAAAESELRAREGRLMQAGSRPNPELSATVENIGGDATETGGMESTLQLGQRFELGGDRGARVAAAAAARDLARWDLKARQLEVASRAALAFSDVVSAQRRVELANEIVRLTDEVRVTVAARVEAGKVSPIEETRAEVALATEKIEQQRASADLAIARSRLAATWGSPTPRFDRVVGERASSASVPSLESIAEQIEQHPYVARWDAEVAEREALLRVERARGVPDVTVSGGYRSFEAGSGAAVASASIPLPLFDRNRGAQSAAHEHIARARHERSAALLRLQNEAAETHAALVRVESEVLSLRDEVVPGAESVYAAVSEGYRLGKFGYMEVLDARRTLAAVRVQHARSEAELQRHLAELQRITGTAAAAIDNGEKQ